MHFVDDMCILTIISFKVMYKVNTKLYLYNRWIYYVLIALCSVNKDKIFVVIILQINKKNATCRGYAIR